MARAVLRLVLCILGIAVVGMLTYRGFEAWVECDGEPLRSYDAWCEGRAIGATVASEAGKSFGIHWRDLEGGVESFGIVTIDGTIVGGRGLNGTPGRAVAKTAWRPRDAAPGVPERQLVFAPLITTDDENMVLSAAAAPIDKVGTIELKVDLVRYGARMRDHRPPPPDRDGGPDPYSAHPFKVRVVHETSKKMGGHQVSLGEALPVRGGSRHTLPPKRKRLPYDDRDQGPHVIFRFSYAPRDILVAQGVIPRSDLMQIEPAPPPAHSSQPQQQQQRAPPPPPLFTRSDTVDLTQDDGAAPAPAAAKAERAASVLEQKELVGVLQEQLRHAREELARKQASVKVEQTPEPFSAYRYFKPGEVIDLTDL